MDGIGRKLFYNAHGVRVAFGLLSLTLIAARDFHPEKSDRNFE